jgi:hypothetical protein
MIALETVGITEALVRNQLRMRRLEDMTPEMDAAGGAVYAATRSWMESNGDGSWPPLAASTIARKAAQGYGDPERPLYAEGNLFDSATSPSGVHAFHINLSEHSLVLGVDWAEGGWQIPTVLHSGTTTAGRDHNVTIPARPIWPGLGSSQYSEMRAAITALMLMGV